MLLSEEQQNAIAKEIDSIVDDLFVQNSQEDSFDNGFNIGITELSETLKDSLCEIAHEKTENMLKIKIGLLRQWLNEDRIDNPDKFVTNEMLEQWLIK